MNKNNNMNELKILIVEDEAKLANLFKEALSDYFYSITIAVDGQDGYEKFLKIKPDLVMTDINMPNMNGLDMTIKIKENKPTTPIIILSAFSDKDKLLKAIDIGINKYFIKPFDPDEVIDYIRVLSNNINKQRIINISDEFYFDNNTKNLYKDKILIKITKREKMFLELLINKKDNILPIDDIKLKLWENEEISEERIRTFVRRFRNKTSKDILQNISGQGYKLSITNT